MSEPVVMAFIDATLGCRFRYIGDTGIVWIKLSSDDYGLIAEYREDCM